MAGIWVPKIRVLDLEIAPLSLFVLPARTTMPCSTGGERLCEGTFSAMSAFDRRFAGHCDPPECERLDFRPRLAAGRTRPVRLRAWFHCEKLQNMINGTVKFYNATKGFGFITPADGSKDAFVHVTALERAGMSGLAEGQKVSYDLETGRDGKASAVNLALV